MRFNLPSLVGAVPFGTPYKTSVVNSILKALKARTDQDDDLDDQPGYAVLYVAGQNDAALTDALFPSILTLPVDWTLSGYSKKDLAQSKGALVHAFHAQAISARPSLDVLAREMKSQAQRTPWLLPVHNFRSKHLRPGLTALVNELTAAQDKLGVLRDHNNAFRQRHPPQSEHEGHHSDRDYFVDDSGLRFKPPGADVHGYHTESDKSKCNDTCHIASRRRLGAPYLKSFHYDCTKGEVPTKAWLCNCHDTTMLQKQAKKNFNIAPNDFTRP